VNLSTFLSVISARKVVVASVLVGTLVIAAIVSFTLPATYTATSTLRVATRTSLSSDVVRSDDSTYLDRLQNTYAQLATSRPLVTELTRELRLPHPPSIALRPVPNTELMQLEVGTSERTTAAPASNRLAELLIARIQQLGADELKRSDAASEKEAQKFRNEIIEERALYETLRHRVVKDRDTRTQLLQLGIDLQLKRTALLEQQRQYQQDRLARLERADAISTVVPAVPPTGRSSPNLKTNLLLAGVLGLLGGIGIAFVLERLRPLIFDREAVSEAAGMPVIGEIPGARTAGGKRSIFRVGTAAEEAFGSLRLRVLASARGQAASSFLVTSAAPGEGKSTIVANLAMAIARSGSRVVAVDGDLRMPQLHSLLDGSNDVGLGGVLEGAYPVDEAVLPTYIENLYMLTSGPPHAVPTELLSRARLRDVNAELKRLFDVVIWDSPAILGIADTLALAPIVDGVVLVVRRSRTRRDELRMALDELAGVDVVPMGAILNCSHEHAGRAYLKGVAA
jgi:capsular exopolysaccharide synthesis family protein